LLSKSPNAPKKKKKKKKKKKIWVRSVRLTGDRSVGPVEFIGGQLGQIDRLMISMSVDSD